MADTGNHRIQIFTVEMKFLHKFPIFGSDGVDYPIGIAVDKGRVYVAEHAAFWCSPQMKVGYSNFGNSLGLRSCWPCWALCV